MSETAAVPADRRAAEERVALDRTWSRPAGLYGWLCAADHKTIGMRYLVTAFGFFMLAGLLAAAMRLQLAAPENDVLGPDLYNQMFTTHGTTMMFLFAVPIMQGLGVYLVPLMVGTREIAFPRLNAFGYWVYLFGGLMLYRRVRCSTSGRMPAGSPTCRCPARNTRRASAPTSGRR